MSGETPATTIGPEGGSGARPADAPSGATVDVKASALRFVYPFVFPGEAFDSHLRALEEMRWSEEEPFPVWDRVDIPTDDLLSYVANFVNPASGAPVSARFFAMSAKALRSSSGLAAGSGRSVAGWVLGVPRGEIAFSLEAVGLALFRDGVGFLTFDTRPSTRLLNEWLDFLSFFRFTRGQRQVGLRLSRTVLNPETGQPSRVPFFPARAATSARAEGRGQLDAIIDAVLGVANGRWWEDIFVPGQLLPYATMYVDGVPLDEAPTLVYRIRNFFHSRQQLAPAESDLRLEQPAVMPYAEKLWFTFSLDGGAFVALDAPNTPFFRQLMPQHLATQYYLLFLLALEQRFTLLRLTQEVARNWVPETRTMEDGARADAFARIRDALLSFTAEGYFAQVMQQEHHHRCYRRWQETFQVARLYDEVSSEVREMHGYLDLRYRQRLEQITRQQEEVTKRVERRLSLVAWLIGSPTLLFVFLAAIPGIRELHVPFLDTAADRPLFNAGITLILGVVAFAAGALAYLGFERHGK